MITEIVNRPYSVINDIFYFVPEEERYPDSDFVKGLTVEGWIERNWDNHLRYPNKHGVFAADRMTQAGGLILEIGAGPGGGLVPYILDKDKDANIIISDISPTVVNEWKKFLSKTADRPNVMYATMDNCDMPFKDGVVDIVSSFGGFGNTEGDQFKALSEIYRIIKHGGMYVSGEIFVDKDHVSTLSPDSLKIIKEQFPTVFIDFYQESLNVGFNRIENIEGGKWSNKDDRSGLADLCRKLGVCLIFSTYLRFCYKD
jgi:SAM-dependent methyltransferase